MTSCTVKNYSGGRRRRNRTQGRKKCSSKNRRSRNVRQCTCKGACKCGRKCHTCGKVCCRRKYMGG